jgi:hypothetical protein
MMMRDEEVFTALNELYNNRFKQIVFRGASTDEEEHYRHFSFGCVEQNNATTGVHVYLDLNTNSIFHIYESAGEGI